MDTTRIKATTAAIASVAVPALLFFSAGSAQANTPACNVPQVQGPAACTDLITIPQPQLAPGLSREWFRPDPVFRSPRV